MHYTRNMLKLSENLIGRPVMSLRTGQQIATTRAAIFNPDNLHIEGFYCSDKFSRNELVLLYQDVRDVIPQGIVVNDHDVLTEPHELVRLKKIMDIGFELIGKQVVSLEKRKLGKVTDYATEIETMYVQKIYTSQGLLRGLTRGNLAIDRSQINEITDTKIIVNDPLESGAVPAGSPA